MKIILFFQRICLKLKIIRDLLQYLWRKRLWWMIPFVFIIVFLGVLIWCVQSSVVSPFVYTLF
jgi:hypothetical protein